MTQFVDQVKITLLSHPIKGNLTVLQKLLKYFISAFAVPATLVLFNNLDLNLNDSKFGIGYFSLSQQH